MSGLTNPLSIADDTATNVYGAGLETAPPSSSVATFMFGFERSGTTLLSMIVGAHPEIAVPLTVTGMWFRFGHRLAEYNDLKTQQDVEIIVDDLLDEERIHLWDEPIERSEILDNLPTENFGAIVARFHEVYAKKKGKKYWANLDIATLDALDTVHQWFPSARYIHIVRDARDVALSHATMPYSSGNTLDCAERWDQRLRTNLKMGAMLGDSRYFVVRYEDLITNTESTLQRICSFLGVTYDAAMLEYPGMVESKVPKHRRWLWPALDSPPDASKVGQWRTKMGAAKRFVVESHTGHLLTELGYPDSQTSSRSVRGLLYELYCVVDRGSRIKRLARKFGFNRTSKLERDWQNQVHTEGNNYKSTQQAAFGALVNQGIYSTRFSHNAKAQTFFENCMDTAIGEIDSSPNSISILDAGCGPGAWLDTLLRASRTRDWPTLSLYGFDLTEEMVDVARRRLRRYVPAENIYQGDVTESNDYRISKPDGHDLIFSYDVIQQLPTNLQHEAVYTLISGLRPGGIAVIFDHDKNSKYGRMMGRKKFVTRYFGISLVPRYYCNARYPDLSRLHHELESKGHTVRKLVDGDQRKNALIVKRR